MVILGSGGAGLMVRREVVDTCLIDVIRVANKSDLSTGDHPSLLAALLTSGAIQ
jgi:hypothetical protein